MEWRTKGVNLGQNFKITDNGNVLDLRTNECWFDEVDETNIITHSLGYGLLVIDTQYWSKLFDVNKSDVLYDIEGVEHCAIRYTYFHKIGILQLTDFMPPEIANYGLEEYLMKYPNRTWFINAITGMEIAYNQNSDFVLSAYPNPDVFPEVLKYYTYEQLDDYYYTYYYNDKKYLLSKEVVNESEKCLEYISNIKDGKKLIVKVFRDRVEVLVS